ncbi:MAG: response regulator [Proteobacteria bacterium]|nr:response regulator [Pseudomonadota bacterium]
MIEPSDHYETEKPADYLEILYRRHFQGAIVRSGASLIMWVFALAAYLANIIKMNHFTGITLSVLYLILINPPTLLILKRITHTHLFGYASLLINFLEILGYTAIIHFLGGIEATYLTPIYAALITYVGVMAPRGFPYVIAFLCSAAFSFVVGGEFFGLLTHHAVIPFFNPTGPAILSGILVVIGLLFVVAYIASLTAGILKKNRNKLREQNLGLMKKTASLEKAEMELRTGQQKLEIRVEERTAELREANDRLRREIGERKRAAEELKQKESLNYALFEYNPEQAIAVDLEGKIIAVNRAKRMSGDRLPKIGDMMYRDYARSHKIDMHSELMECLGSGKLKLFPEQKYRNKFLSVTIAPFSMGAVIISEDITERKRAEEEKEKLEAQNRQLQKTESLGRMAGAIAHHFNNQLGVVIGNLELAMINKLSGTSGPDETLTAAMKAAGKAAEMSGLMLTYLGQSFDKQDTLDLSGICRLSLRMLRAATPKKVVLKTDLPSPGPTVKANENQIQQVLTNLITNAWEAMGDGQGTINLTVKTVSPADITASHRFPVEWKPQENDYACLEAADAGCGIADKDIEKLFDPFFSSKSTGRGMGLAVVLGITKSHGGAVAVESEPGKGSIFRVFLPVSAEEASRQPEKAAEVPKMEGGGTLLLVEDEQSLRKMAGIMLTNMGYTVLQAKDGVEAVEMFQQHKAEIRVVICDLTMPRMDGWGTLAALRKLSPGIPVVLASGYNENQVMAGDHPEWPQAFLGKPYVSKELSDAIQLAMAKKA